MVVTPYISSDSKKQQVETMFNRIAFRYDLLNSLLSFGIHTYWRSKSIKLLTSSFNSQLKDCTLLDVATGTGDFAIDALKLNPKKIIGIDIAAEMIEIGKRKIEKKQLSSIIELRQADSEKLPFENNFFDAATVGFGVRNFENLKKGLSEIYRTLKPNGVFVVLEFSLPQKFPIKQLYKFYMNVICPLVGKLISGDGAAYSYLFRSVEEFPYGENFKNSLMEVGFSQAVFYPQTFGITTIYIAKK